MDRGLLGALPAPTPAPVDPPLAGSMDPRRVRAALVAVLRESATQGDTLLAACAHLVQGDDGDGKRVCVTGQVGERNQQAIALDRSHFSSEKR